MYVVLVRYIPFHSAGAKGAHQRPDNYPFHLAPAEDALRCSKFRAATMHESSSAVILGRTTGRNADHARGVRLDQLLDIR